ncbi:MAG: hypothetical protein IJX42_01155, partial [Oscillospiraceae bacterium]|nr:hypothetical protein [Oscillospiraceae bacterium]
GNKKFHDIRWVDTEEYYTDLLRKTLLKKGYSSNSFPKTFNLKSHIGFKPYMGFYVKSLWKGARGTTFLQKGFPR